MIKDIFAQFIDEIDGAKEYYECALKHRDTKPEFAKIYANMASTELDHASELVSMAKKIVAEERSETKDGVIVDCMEHQLMKAKAIKMAYE